MIAVESNSSMKVLAKKKSIRSFLGEPKSIETTEKKDVKTGGYGSKSKHAKLSSKSSNRAEKSKPKASERGLHEQRVSSSKKGQKSDEVDCKATHSYHKQMRKTSELGSALSRLVSTAGSSNMKGSFTESTSTALLTEPDEEILHRGVESALKLATPEADRSTNNLFPTYQPQKAGKAVLKRPSAAVAGKEVPQLKNKAPVSSISNLSSSTKHDIARGSKQDTQDHSSTGITIPSTSPITKQLSRTDSHRNSITLCNKTHDRKATQKKLTSTSKSNLKLTKAENISSKKTVDERTTSPLHRLLTTQRKTEALLRNVSTNDSSPEKDNLAHRTHKILNRSTKSPTTASLKSNTSLQHSTSKQSDLYSKTSANGGGIWKQYSTENVATILNKLNGKYSTLSKRDRPRADASKNTSTTSPLARTSKNKTSINEGTHSSVLGYSIKNDSILTASNGNPFISLSIS